MAEETQHVVSVCGGKRCETLGNHQVLITEPSEQELNEQRKEHSMKLI